MNIEKITEAEERVILHPVSWRTYGYFLDDFTNCSSPHFTYINESLEITKLSERHEKIVHLLSSIVTFFTQKFDIPMERYGSITLKRNDLKIGTEPDVSFYIQNEPLMRGKSDLDLSKDPPPDLVIEVDITNPSIDKLKVYSELGIPEVWIYKSNDGISFYHLQEGKYIGQETSLSFPGISKTLINKTVEIFQMEDNAAALQFFQLQLKTVN